MMVELWNYDKTQKNKNKKQKEKERLSEDYIEKWVRSGSALNVSRL